MLKYMGMVCGTAPNFIEKSWYGLWVTFTRNLIPAA